MISLPRALRVRRLVAVFGSRPNPAVAVQSRSRGPTPQSPAVAFTHLLMTSQWKPIVIHTDSITISGGYNSRNEPAHSIKYQVDTNAYHYVELSKNARWFVKAVGGANMSNGELKSVSVVSMLRN